MTDSLIFTHLLYFFSTYDTHILSNQCLLCSSIEPNTCPHLGLCIQMNYNLEFQTIQNDEEISLRGLPFRIVAFIQVSITTSEVCIFQN